MLVKNTLVALVVAAPALALPLVGAPTAAKVASKVASAATGRAASGGSTLSLLKAEVSADRKRLGDDSTRLLKEEKAYAKLANGLKKVGQLAKEKGVGRNRHGLRVDTTGHLKAGGNHHLSGRLSGVRTPNSGRLSGLRTPNSGRLSGLRTPNSGRLSGLRTPYSGRVGLTTGRIGGVRTPLSGRVGMRTPLSGRVGGTRTPGSGRLSGSRTPGSRSGRTKGISTANSPFGTGRSASSPYGYQSPSWFNSPYSGGFGGGYYGGMSPGMSEQITWSPDGRTENIKFSRDSSANRLARRALTPTSPAADPATSTTPTGAASLHSPYSGLSLHRIRKAARPHKHTAGEKMALNAMLIEAEHLVNGLEGQLNKAATPFANLKRASKLRKMIKLRGPKATSSSTPSTPTTPTTPTTPLSPKAN